MFGPGAEPPRTSPSPMATVRPAFPVDPVVTGPVTDGAPEIAGGKPSPDVSWKPAATDGAMFPTGSVVIAPVTKRLP